MLSPIAIDYECFYSTRLKYGLRTMIAEQYCSHELFDCYLVSVSDGKTCWAGDPKDLNWSALAGRVWVSHNRRFDNTVHNELIRRKLIPDVQPVEWCCSANLAVYLCNRRALKDSYEFLVGGYVSKDYRKLTDGKNWPQDYTAEEQAQIKAAGIQDANAAWTLWDKFSDQWPEVERRLSTLTINQGMRGVFIDREKLDQYIYQSHEMRGNTEAVIPWIKDTDDGWDEFDTKPTSTKCIAEQCRRIGIPCPPVKSDDEEAYEAWEQQYGPQHPWIAAVGAWRSINKLYKTFLVVKERLRADGTLPFSLKYFGAHTGRWAGDARVNMQNMRKKPIVCNERGLLETDNKRVDLALDTAEETGKMPDWVRYVIDFRSLILPRPGKKMIVSDLSQIEPRVLAWLIGDSEFLKNVAAGDSPYTSHARTSMGFTGVMDKKSDLYKLCKARVLGLGYGCGWEKFIQVAWDLARLDITEDDPEFIEEALPFSDKVNMVSGYGATSKKIVAEFREQNPRITGLWKQLGDAFKSSVGDDFRMQLPNGRKMRYEKVRASVRIEKDPKTGKPVRKSVFTANTDGRWKPFYGGKLTENLVQATARDVFAEQLLPMEDRGWKVLFTSHDEAILEVDPSVTAADVERAMSRAPEWMPGLPVSAEAKEVVAYCK